MPAWSFQRSTRTPQELQQFLQEVSELRADPSCSFTVTEDPHVPDQVRGVVEFQRSPSPTSYAVLRRLQAEAVPALPAILRPGDLLQELGVVLGVVLPTYPNLSVGVDLALEQDPTTAPLSRLRPAYLGLEQDEMAPTTPSLSMVRNARRAIQAIQEDEDREALRILATPRGPRFTVIEEEGIIGISPSFLRRFGLPTHPDPSEVGALYQGTPMPDVDSVRLPDFLLATEPRISMEDLDRLSSPSYMGRCLGAPRCHGQEDVGNEHIPECPAYPRVSINDMTRR